MLCRVSITLRCLSFGRVSTNKRAATARYTAVAVRGTLASLSETDENGLFFSLDERRRATHVFPLRYLPLFTVVVSSPLLPPASAFHQTGDVNYPNQTKKMHRTSGIRQSSARHCIARLAEGDARHCLQMQPIYLVYLSHSRAVLH